MGTLDRTWQGTEPLLGPAIHDFMNMKPDTAIRTKGAFLLASGFALANLLCNHGAIEIPYPTLFPLPISHPNPIKTRNVAPTSNWNSRFPPLFSAQIPNITAKKNPIPVPAKPIYWGPSAKLARQSFCFFSRMQGKILWFLGRLATGELWSIHSLPECF